MKTEKIIDEVSRPSEFLKKNELTLIRFNKSKEKWIDMEGKIITDFKELDNNFISKKQMIKLIDEWFISLPKDSRYKTQHLVASFEIKDLKTKIGKLE